jgi:uncharacterized protein (DUF2236 family)
MATPQTTPLMPPASEWRSLTPHEGTITWRRAGDVRVLLAAGYALLLQVSHPTVGAGVSEHSSFQSDPWGRLLRTLDYSCTMVYAGPAAAGEMGERIRSFHKQISGVTPDGTRYHALEPDAYAWVHATLAAGIVAAHERFGRSFSEAQREQLWAEWRAVGRLLGIRERDLPPDWPSFRIYFQEMVDGTLRRTAAVDEVLNVLARPSPPALAPYQRPMWRATRVLFGHVVRLATTGLLPPALRARFGLPWSATSTIELRALGRALRAATPVMPGYLLNTGPGYLTWRREAQQRGDVASAQLH